MALIFANGHSDVPSTQPPIGKQKKEIGRESVNYHPSVWGDRFAILTAHEIEVDEITKQRAEKLKHDVLKMLHNVSVSLQDLNLIDEIQRLGVGYHFETEIENAMKRIYNSRDNDDDDLHAVALRFRLLRQHGYNVSSDVFKKFKDEKGEFKASLRENVRGLLSFYEAAYLGTADDTILDQAIDFTTDQLKSVLPNLNPPLSELVKLALDVPLHKRIERLQSRYFISIYQEEKERNEVLLEFAKLDFNVLQSLHKEELSQLSRWWKDNDFARKLPFIRDRLVECYFWILGVYYEPRYSRGRMMTTKVISLTSIMDDTYDVYGKLDELELLTTAIERWEWAAMDELPDYMKLHFSALLTAVENFEEELSKEGKAYRISYFKNAYTKLAKAYLEEARWASADYVPTLEEYMKHAQVSSAYPVLTLSSLLGMGATATKEAFEWAINMPNAINAISVVCRLKDDITSAELEQQRVHVATAVECYIKENGTTYEETCKLFKQKVDSAWKEINKEWMDPLQVPREIIKRAVNFARVIEFLYRYKDMYTESAGETKECIAMVLVDRFVD
uniref:Sesquiterpene synthase TPS2 n=1 Tax=Cananga odorata TaxID=13393 RepID=TPS2_CANOD|nr:RecName: Full=Sesquiterpene synthase TPS2; AltName: Full=Beta-copaene synthase TPS2; AltName: Full=Beta-cubebene synthase TPS2; AltName: Full=Beta-ylangene synthase TPS2; AltName: Full=Terpene synthase 2; Short=CoTPS2 [Cananga odorata]QMW48843.1 terpene synthase 2 [Cananga odorata]